MARNAAEVRATTLPNASNLNVYVPLLHVRGHPFRRRH